METIGKGEVIVALDGLNVLGNYRVMDALHVDRNPKVRNALHVYPMVRWFKLHEALDRFGTNYIRQLKARYPNIRIWADLKLHDVPFAVEMRVRALAQAGADAVSIHLAGGFEMVAWAMSTASSTGIMVIGIASLSSHHSDQKNVNHLVETVAAPNNVHAVVGGNPQWYSSILRSSTVKIVAGVRRVPIADRDHVNPVTPHQAIHEMGADAIVVGRPITMASDPFQALTNILDSIESQ